MARIRSSSSVVALVALLSGLTLVVGCGEPPQVTGNVKDIWGRPIEGATVILEGETEQQITNVQGAFKFAAPDNDVRLMAGKDGYIKDVRKVGPLAEGEDQQAAIVFELYPDPEDVGFYAIGNDAYLPLPSFEAQTKGTEVRAVTGIRDVGTVALARGVAPRFVFSSKLRAERLAQLDLQLTKLEFTQEATLPGVLGETPTDLNLWTAAGVEIPYDLVVLPSRDDFLIKLREPLPAGAYAFHTQGALTTKSYDGLDKLPKELRLAYAFEVR